MIEQDLFNALKGLVSNRVYPLVMPQSPTYPAIVYNRIAVNAQNVLEGGSTIDQVRFQVDTYATTYAGAKTIAAQVRVAVEAASFKGTLQSDQDFFEPDINLYRVSQDFYIWEKRG